LEASVSRRVLRGIKSGRVGEVLRGVAMIPVMLIEAIERESRWGIAREHRKLTPVA
jgi:hypothetical protein